MRLMPVQRIALVVLAATTLPLAWYIVANTDPHSMDPLAEARHVLQAMAWVAQSWAVPPFVSWCARAWGLAALTALFWRPAARSWGRLWAWVQAGSWSAR